MGNACLNNRRISASLKETVHDEQINHDVTESKSDNVDGRQFIPFLNSKWPGSILDWTQDDLESFAQCFTPFHVNAGEEVCLHDLLFLLPLFVI